MQTPLPQKVAIRESSLRDGLQSVSTIVPTAAKLEWIDAAYAAGIREIEVGSFVPAHLLPQLADTRQLVAHALSLPGLVVSCLVPNLKGAEAALESGVHMLTVPLSASSQHSQANLRKTPDGVVDEIRKIVQLRDTMQSPTLVEGGVGTAFGCTLQGAVPKKEVVRLAKALLDAGVDKISLADTVGYGDPAAVQDLLEEVAKIAGDRLWSAHFHDTRGLGLANVFAALNAGVRRFDSCLGGIGGCPHAPGASGNVATEDVNFLLTSMGISTGVTTTALLALRERIAVWLEGETLHGSIWRAGLPLTHPELEVH